jgi:acyl-coenzyme A thioesterase PaaI-like protein
MSKEWFEHLKVDYVQGFPAYCGFEVLHVAHGIFETRLKLRPEHRQQDGFVHAGVMATMADHTAGYAAFTTCSRRRNGYDGGSYGGLCSFYDGF